MSKFYGIGVGVGDPEMITLKAINILKKLDILILPNAGRDIESTAYKIVREYLKSDIKFVDMEISMNPNIEKRKEERIKNSKIIEEYLEKNLNVGFITIGDPMTYSTYVYLLENINEKYQVETIPGISSFVDISSRINIPLVVGDETLKVISLSKKCTSKYIAEEIQSSDNIVVMKVSLRFNELKEALKITGNEKNIALVCESGKDEQKIYFNLENLTKEDIPYFSTLILKKGGIEKWKKFIS